LSVNVINTIIHLSLLDCFHINMHGKQPGQTILANNNNNIIIISLSVLFYCGDPKKKNIFIFFMTAAQQFSVSESVYILESKSR